MRLTSRSFLLPKSFFNKGANISAGSSTRMDGGRPHESPMQPSWLRAKGAFYPETAMNKAALSGRLKRQRATTGPGEVEKNAEKRGPAEDWPAGRTKRIKSAVYKLYPCVLHN